MELADVSILFGYARSYFHADLDRVGDTVAYLQVREEDETRPLDEWLYARREDVFPELFPQFLGVPKPLREALREAHGEIFDAMWWRDVQARLRAGEYLDVAPYPASARLDAATGR